MAVMTDGLKALAGSALRVVLAKAAATSISGTFWVAVVTLLVQSSSATTMTTIGLVSAGLLTFPQGLSLVFGANIGTTGTGWLVALLGVALEAARRTIAHVLETLCSSASTPHDELTVRRAPEALHQVCRPSSRRWPNHCRRT